MTSSLRKKKIENVQCQAFVNSRCKMTKKKSECKRTYPLNLCLQANNLGLAPKNYSKLVKAVIDILVFETIINCDP